MKKRIRIALALALPVLTAVGFYGYQKWGPPSSSPRQELLAMMPAEASAVVFLDLHELRGSPFVAQLYAWAPKPQADQEYMQFLKDTGFDYERDLARVAVAFKRNEQQESMLFAVADGNFDRQKISSLALKTGTLAKSGNHEIFSVPISGSAKSFSFTFLRNDRIALSTGPALSSFLLLQKLDPEIAEWRLRFQRLARTPVFAVLRQDAGSGDALRAQTPGGLGSPQLSSLLDQLEWITIAGKPENDRLHVTAEGDSSAERTAGQLADLLSGILVLAEAGLNDRKTRQQLNPTARAAYLDLLKSVAVQKIDRGDIKSVRVSIDISLAFLEAARHPAPELPGATPRKTHPGVTPSAGRT